jgi:hypothetical protein
MISRDITSQTGRPSIPDKDTQASAHPLSLVAVTIAPIVAFALANALFLPIVEVVADVGNSILGRLLASVNNVLASYLIVALFLLLLPLSAGLVLVSPALASFVANTRLPVARTWRMAFLSGIVFFLCHTIVVIILVVYRNSTLTPMPAGFPSPSPAVDPVASLGLLSGVVMSCSVTLFAWLGARRGRKRA